jgi:iodotyrosine deiodinase
MPVTAGRPHWYPFVLYRPARYPEAEMLGRGREFRDFLDSRRSVRSFSSQPVPRECIDLAIECANTAPVGRPPAAVEVRGDRRPADQAPDPGGRRGGGAAELRGRPAAPGVAGGPGKAGDHIGQGLPGCGAVDRSASPRSPPSCPTAAGGRTTTSARVRASRAGFSSPRCTGWGWARSHPHPNPMGFLNEICQRPPTERPYILFPVGYPAADAEVPDLQRKTLAEVTIQIPRPEQ